MPDATGPWWVQDKETGHKFVSHVLGEHLEVLDESPFTPGGEFRTAEPAAEVRGAKTKKEASK